MHAPSFQLSTDSKALAQRLRECVVGDKLSYDALSAVIDRDVRIDGRGSLASARKIVMREHRIVFDVVRNEGLQRLNDTQIVSLSGKARDHIRKTTRKTVRALTCVDYDAMDRGQQVKHNTELSTLGVIAELTTERSIARLAVKVEEAGTEIPAVKAAIAALGSTVR